MKKIFISAIIVVIIAFILLFLLLSNPKKAKWAYDYKEIGLAENLLTYSDKFLDDLASIEYDALGHYALANLEKMGILKLTITQNVDGLHQKAGSQYVIVYHGGLSKLRCIDCGSRNWER
jgi:hypothetical protein